MMWIAAFSGLALAGLVVLAILARGVRHKLTDVLDEVKHLNQRRTELKELTASIQLPPRQPQ
ncbi:MAG: hypothetical protein Q4D79_09615 [Propionibacteriaceae bacterium]|nr:hypothetical protein [Propionibacteriaceae bacterium]